MFDLRTLLAVALVAVATPAVAATQVHLELAGAHSASFDLLEAPTPTSFILGSSFDITGVSGVFEGIAGVRTVRFFNNALGGGFAVLGDFVVNYVQLYSGTEAQPKLYSGDYQLIDPATGETAGLIIYQNGEIGVPEPEMWALLVVGFGMVGGAIRSRWRAAGVRRA